MRRSFCPSSNSSGAATRRWRSGANGCSSRRPTSPPMPPNDSACHGTALSSWVRASRCNQVPRACSAVDGLATLVDDEPLRSALDSRGIGLECDGYLVARVAHHVGGQLVGLGLGEMNSH